MSLIKKVRGKTPTIGRETYIAENATIVGDVIIGEQCSIWFQAIIRGDVNEIRIGHKTNIQDGAVLHCTYQKTGLYIGDSVSIGHRAIVHGCTLQDNVMVGMGAIVMDRAVVESGALVAAGAVVTEDTIVRTGEVFAGVPARKVKEVDSDSIKHLLYQVPENYIKYASWFTKSKD